MDAVLGGVVTAVVATVGGAVTVYVRGRRPPATDLGSVRAGLAVVTEAVGTIRDDLDRHLNDWTGVSSRIGVIETQVANLVIAQSASDARAQRDRAELLEILGRMAARVDEMSARAEVRDRELRLEMAPRFSEVNTRIDAVGARMGERIDVLAERRTGLR